MSSVLPSHGAPQPRSSTEAPERPLGWADQLAEAQRRDEDRARAAGRFDAVPAAEPLDRALPGQVTPQVQPWPRRLRAVLVLSDVLAALLCLTIAWRHAALDVEALLVPGGAVAVVVALTTAGAYELRHISRTGTQLRRVALGLTGLTALSSMGALALDAARLRSLVLLGLPLTWIVTALVRVAAGLALGRMRAAGRCRRKVVVIGLERSVAELARAVARDPHTEMTVVAACVRQARDRLIEGVEVLGAPDRAREVVLRTGADAVVLTSWSDVSPEDLRRLAWDLEGSGVQLLVAPRLGDVAPPRLTWQHVGGIALVDVEEPTFTGVRRVAKKAVDLVGATVAVVLLSPVMLAVVLAVRLGSPGPVLFRQRRVGRHGELFTMHKFRSMYVDAEARLADLAADNQHGEGPLFKMRDDPRITPVGAFLRRFSLDELPQLFDVLIGSMSLVGPRPPLEAEVAQYEDDVRRRLAVAPGITGLWQVSGRSDLSWEESVRLDLHYVENWSLALDLSIIARTVSAVLARRGAY